MHRIAGFHYNLFFFFKQASVENQQGLWDMLRRFDQTQIMTNGRIVRQATNIRICNFSNVITVIQIANCTYIMQDQGWPFQFILYLSTITQCCSRCQLRVQSELRLHMKILSWSSSLSLRPYFHSLESTRRLRP